MKIVQTLWTKPVFADSSGSGHRFNGGWLSRKYYYISWALSCLRFLEYYDNVELVTDSRGKSILVDSIKLPYTNVKVELDCLNHYPDSLWTLPKIFTYQIQKEPFIHADGDIFIWEKLIDDIENAPLCSQQLVTDHKPQYTTMDEIINYLDFIPDCIRKDFVKSKMLSISNAGILGGTNLEFFAEFCDLSFEFVNKNLSHLDKIKSGNFGMIFEEYLFYCLAKEKGCEITYLTEPDTDDFKGIKLVDFESVPKVTKYIHPVGNFKKYPHIADLMADTLLLNYPDYYFRIMDLLNDFEI
jgi:hypothetical protein